MEFGLVYDFRNSSAAGITTPEMYRRTLDHICEAERMGIDAVWLTEHHLMDDGYLPSLLTMAAAIAVRTTTVVIGTAVLLLPLHHPLRIAEDAAVVDNLSDGRLRLGVGAGYVQAEFDAFGVDRRRRGSLMESGVATLRDAWGSGTITPKPARSPMPIWMGARAPVTAERAGRIGDGVLISPDRTLIDTYRSARADAGKAGPGGVGAFVYVYPVDDPESAASSLGAGVSYRFDRYSQWYGQANDLPGDRSEGAFDPRHTFATTEVLIAQLRRLEAMGVNSLLWFATLPGYPPEATLPLIETLMTEVKPALAQR